MNNNITLTSTNDHNDDNDGANGSSNGDDPLNKNVGERITLPPPPPPASFDAKNIPRILHKPALAE